MKMISLMTWLLAMASYTTAAGQAGAPERSVPSWMGRFSSVPQSEQGRSLQGLPQREQTLLRARTVTVVVGQDYPSARAEQALRKELIRWGRFQLVDDAATADLIIVISDDSSSKRMMMERVRECMTVFAGGSTLGEDAAPIWSVEETGPALGNKRPTQKLVQDLRKDMTELEKPVLATLSPSSKSQQTKNQNSFH